MNKNVFLLLLFGILLIFVLDCSAQANTDPRLYKHATTKDKTTLKEREAKIRDSLFNLFVRQSEAGPDKRERMMEIAKIFLTGGFEITDEQFRKLREILTEEERDILAKTLEERILRGVEEEFQEL